MLAVNGGDASQGRGEAGMLSVFRGSCLNFESRTLLRSVYFSPPTLDDDFRRISFLPLLASYYVHERCDNEGAEEGRG